MHRVIYLKTTEFCQLNCKHCFTGGNKPPKDFINLNKFSEWIKKYNSDAGATYTTFILHGGEPFLAPITLLNELHGIIKSHVTHEYALDVCTNLTYKLNDDLYDFIKDKIDGFSTSWDLDIRFTNKKQEDLWRSNLKRINDIKDVTLNISLSKSVLSMDTDLLIKFIRDTNVKSVAFDRITINGNARSNQGLFPDNNEINDWYLRLHESTIKLDARHWFYNSTLEDVYEKFEKGNSCSGTFCRDCEQKIFTLNVDGTIGGCPNSAPEKNFGSMDDDINSLLTSPKRIEEISLETMRNPLCYTCEVFNVCGSDCHQLTWDGDICPSPKKLMYYLSGKTFLNNTKRKKVIPIFLSKGL